MRGSCSSRFQTARANSGGTTCYLLTLLVCEALTRAGGSCAEVFGDGFGAGADVQFVVDVADVVNDGPIPDLQLVRNLLGEIAL